MRLALGMFLAFAALPTWLQAAPVAWQVVRSIDSDADVCATGALIRAINFGASGTNPLINGVVFTGAAVSGNNQIVGTGPGAVQFSGTFSSSATYGGAAAPFTALSANYRDLMSSAVTGPAVSTLTLTGLVTGQKYLVQFWVNNSGTNSAAWTRTETFTAGGPSGALDHNVQNVAGGVGQYVLGTFVADSASQIITVSSNAAVQVNAFQLRAMPTNTAVISWQNVQNISGDGDVNTTGSLVQALNLGASGTNVTVNGVTFVGAVPGSSAGTGEGAIEWSGAYTVGGLNGTAAPYTSLSSNYKTLLSSCAYTYPATTATVALKNLIPGKKYLVQFWMNDSRDASSVWTRNVRFSSYASSTPLDMNVQNANGGLGQYVVGTFTADSSTQLVTLTGDVVTQMNAYQLRGLNAVGSGVVWQAAQSVSGDGDINTQGALVKAFKLGLSGTSITVNGVAFTGMAAQGSDITLGSGEGAVRFTTVGGNNWYYYNGVQGTLAPYTALSPSCQTLLASCQYAYPTPSGTLTLQNLILGQRYLIQMWVGDSRDSSAIWNRSEAFTSGNVSEPLDYNVQNVSGGVGQYIIGTFTATAATQAIAVAGDAGANVQVNALQIRSLRPVLASLNWTECSDWINVKTDVTPAALGNGINDDTAAIQAAINMNIGVPVKPIYLPPGTYKITNTLHAINMLGAVFIGHGKDTRIVWSGSAGGRMFWSDGCGNARYVGIVWDGNNIANFGITHDVRSPNYFETNVRHHNEQFINFLKAGVATGEIIVGNAEIASAEVHYDHCLFYNCDAGVEALSSNDLNHIVRGCEFQDCNVSIRTGVNSNVGVFDTHFERSAEADLELGTHSHVVARCTSIDSGKFVQRTFSSADAPLRIGDCRISGWKTPGGGALNLNLRGPVIVHDTTFVNPPDNTPPVYFRNWGSTNQTSILSNVSSPATTATYGSYPGSPFTVRVVPSGTGQPTPITPTTSFYRKTVYMPSSMIDVKASPYNAAGNGTTDDTTAIRSAITAAKAAGNNCMVYFPTGNYKVTGELDMKTGSNYSIGGAGFNSAIIYSGTDSSLFHLKDPQNLRIENLRIEAPSDKIRILQESTANTASSVVYDNVRMEIYSGTNAATKGLEIRDLPSNAKALMPHFAGDAKFVNCSAGTILADVWYGGTLRISSSQNTSRTGFIGAIVHFVAASGLDYGIVIEGNDSFFADYEYCEQIKHHLKLSGATVTGISGRVTLGGVKLGVTGEDNVAGGYGGSTGLSYDDVVLDVDHYQGRLAYFGAQLHYQSPAKFSSIVSLEPFTLILGGCSYWWVEPQFSNFDISNRTLILAQNLIFSEYEHSADVIPDTVPSGGDAEIRSALDDFLILGNKDLELNYP